MREVLYNILLETGVPMKLVRLIKMYLNETCNKVCISNYWPPLWSSGHSSWLQIHRSGFDSRHYQIFWEVVDLWNGVHSASWVQLRSYLEKM
jgi:hypothetical protein